MSLDSENIAVDTWPLVVVRHWRIVKEDGGIMFTATSAECAPKEIIDRWMKRFSEHGLKVHVEIWDQTYRVPPSTWTRVDG